MVLQIYGKEQAVVLVARRPLQILTMSRPSENSKRHIRLPIQERQTSDYSMFLYDLPRIRMMQSKEVITTAALRFRISSSKRANPVAQF